MGIRNMQEKLKKSNWPTEIFKIANSQKFIIKISQIGPWLSRIDWCEGHWCGSTCLAVRHKLKLGLKNTKNAYFTCFWAYCFGPIKMCFFPTAKTKKNSWKKLGKTLLVVWWFDVTNKILISQKIFTWNQDIPSIF